MPRYDFECPDHGEFEAAVTFKDADKPQRCPTVVGTGGHCKERGHKVNKEHQHTIYPIQCEKMCKRVERLYTPGAIYKGAGFTKGAAEIDSENTRKYGHTV